MEMERERSTSGLDVEKAVERATKGTLPEDFCKWSAKAENGDTIAHIAAKSGTIPENFDWDEYGRMKNEQGKTVIYTATENGNLPENIQSMSMKQLQNINQKDFDKMYSNHQKWLETDGVEGNRLVLHKYDLSNVNFPKNANLQKADLSYSNLSKQDLKYADMRLDNLKGANLSGAVLHKANLSEADLSGANLSDAILNRANLSNVNFSNSILKNAVLDSAIIKKANFDNAIVVNADFDNVDYLSTRNRQTALGWADKENYRS